MFPIGAGIQERQMISSGVIPLIQVLAGKHAISISVVSTPYTTDSRTRWQTCDINICSQYTLYERFKYSLANVILISAVSIHYTRDLSTRWQT